MRRSHYIGLAKAALQQAPAAVGINVARGVQWLVGRGQAITRTS